MLYRIEWIIHSWDYKAWNHLNLLEGITYKEQDGKILLDTH